MHNITIWLAALLLCCATRVSSAQELDVRVSSRETYVGQPIELQIAIDGTVEINPPTLPEVDGCEIQSMGPPDTSSRVMIINGRRSESYNVLFRYRITPRRAGTFQVPAFVFSVNGQQRKTPEFEFVAEKSETGDLLFVEVEAEEQEVYVGEPLKLTLKIWVKPFVDPERGFTLSEGNMWQMMSAASKWGVFAVTMEELNKQGLIPEGREVLHEDGTGKMVAYYLYELHATVYPKRAEMIDAADVQIVLDYPMKLDVVRGAFDSLFGGSLFANDPFFDSSLGNRLAVSKYRPITATATVDATQVIPIPTAGRPADYRGAVGNYQIVTTASNTRVNAGDAIELRIGIVGNGPMELVQAPPLHTLESLTADFKVETASLAGFVQNDVKVFPTTIRPRREGITSIPAIPLSFFDPETESYHTVYSEPISITVDKAESLALDAIVSNAQQRNETPDAAPDTQRMSTSQPPEPDLANSESLDVLISQPTAATADRWLLFLIVPPCVWLGVTLLQYRRSLAGWGAALAHARHSPEQRCLQAIERASQQAELRQALVHYIDHRTGTRRGAAEATGDDTASFLRAVGQLRILGAYPLAADIERWWDSNATLEDQKRSMHDLLARLTATFRSQPGRIKPVRVAVRPQHSVHGKAPTSDLTHKTLSLFLLLGLSTAAGNGMADNEIANDREADVSAAAGDAAIARERVPSATVPSATVPSATVPSATVAAELILSDEQKRQILAEAGELYRRGRESAEREGGLAKDLFVQAADKYQLLIDAGIANSRLFMNAGNAYLLSDQLGRAIACYERARQLDPSHRGLHDNLKFAQSLVKSSPEAKQTSQASALANNTLAETVQAIPEQVAGMFGIGPIKVIMATASVVFWCMLIVGQICSLSLIRRLAIVPLMVLLVAIGFFAVRSSPFSGEDHGILLTNKIALRAGDGVNFDEVTTLENADGQVVKVLRSRAGWREVQTSTGARGWLPEKQIAVSPQ